ncbi:hypothetical protein CHS0354_004816 [Potamilus streckersoni]|uniref:Uncharacterized protein n=1 Tax=Potamilus streckersoni TaxID=2493646 RepID=A0AAE0S941_9BIVA|nr:hypothetical protein CHS0354_004816 [Potamilus streckersoni]
MTLLTEAGHPGRLGTLVLNLAGTEHNLDLGHASIRTEFHTEMIVTKTVTKPVTKTEHVILQRAQVCLE